MIAFIRKLLGKIIRMPAVNPGYSDVALGHVAEGLAKTHLPAAAEDIATIRKAKMAKPSADLAKSDAVVARASAAAEADNIRKRAQAQRECEALAKKIEATKDPLERRVLMAERVAAQAERFADASDRADEVIARLRAKGRKVGFDPMNLEQLIRLGADAEQRIASGGLDEVAGGRGSTPGRSAAKGVLDAEGR